MHGSAESASGVKCLFGVGILLMLDFGGVFAVLTQIFIWLSVTLTIISLLTYIMQNRKVLSMQE